ncbi:hypothetical protein Bca4012_071620 [Brassica carinata]|uniref:C2H2-type domain-containing protein n=2 Tax=Brassica oleracea TaxID=3712 RepID=A0A0D3CD23_BRAOL|nr:PREDICTED: zinc finger protein ZAT9-like [Brassica oleracea var. oleracea]VDD43633.1 unnamed protein product [Brassica oleracea]
MEKEFVCKFCNKKFPSGKSLGGHIRIHSPQSSVHSDSFIGKNNNSKKRLVDQRALASHMDCHNYEGKKMGTQSASETTTTSSGPTMIKRSKKHSSSESFSTVSWSSDPGIDQGSKDLMFLHLGRKDYNFNSLVPESSENNSEILETKTSSGELLKTPAKVSVVDDSSSDSDYFMNGPKKSDSDVSVGGSLRNTGFGSGFNSFKNGDDLGVKEGGSKHELGKSKRVSPFYESDSSADTNSKFHRSSDGKSPMAKKASGGVKNSKGHECPICFKVYSSGQALGGHKRSHTIANQAQRAKRKAADMQFDLNLPAEDTDD